MSTNSNSINCPDSPTHSLEAEAGCQARESSQAELQHLANGDSSAFWKLWEEHEGYLYRICLRQLDGVQEEAEDALSILMVKLLDLLPRYADRIENLRAWLARITYNLCIDIRRELKRSKTLASIEELTGRDAGALLSSIESPEDTALRLESRQFIYSAIESLSTSLRVPFLLRHYYEWPYDDIATRLEITPANARKRSQLARALLQQSLGKYLTGGAVSLPRRTQFDPDVDLQPYFAAPINNPKPIAVRLINVVVNSGLERSFCIHLSHKPASLSPKIEQVLRYTSSHPGGWKKRLELAQLLYEAGEWKAAIQEYERVLEKQPGMLNVYLELGNVLSLMDNAPASIATYQRALQFINEPDDRHHLKGMIALRRRNYREAIAEFRKATEIQPDKVAHWNGMAMVHLLTDSPLEALTSCKESLKLDPNDARALTHMPSLLLDLGRVREASRCLVKALDRHAGNVLSIKALADYRSQQRMVFGYEGNRTRKLIEQAMRLAAESPEVHDSLSWFHLCRGDWQKGVSVLRLFAERHRSSPEAWRYYAKAAYRTGDLQIAGEAIRRAHALDPHSWRTNMMACEILSWQPPDAGLRALFEGMLVKFFERWTIWGKVALALIKTFRDAERAREISAEAPRLQPQLSPAWFIHSRVLSLAHKYEDAIITAEIGWRWLPKDEEGSLSVPAAFGLAENHLLINAPDKSEPWLREALVRLPELISLDPAKGYYWRGKLLELSGDKRAAATAFATSVKHNLFYPERSEAENALARLTTRLSKRAGAFPVG